MSPAVSVLHERAEQYVAMRRMLATGRCCWQNLASPALEPGPARLGRLCWRVGADGRQTVAVALDDPSAVVLPAGSPWYVLPAEQLAGPIELNLARPLVRVALSAPPVTKAQAAAVGAVLERELPGLALPRPRSDILEEIRKDPPVPVLTLVQRRRGWNYWGGSIAWAEEGRVLRVGPQYRSGLARLFLWRDYDRSR